MINRELVKDSTTVLDGLVTYAVEVGISKKNKLGIIPEIGVQAEDVAVKLFNALSDYYENKGEKLDIDMFLMWCVFAGIGGAYLWQYQWEKIKDIGVLDALLSEGTLFELDKRVLELAGLSADSDEGNRVWQACEALGVTAFDDYYDDDINDSETALLQIKELGKACYQYGVALGLEMLGM